jgi:hypothetical protein
LEVSNGEPKQARAQAGLIPGDRYPDKKHIEGRVREAASRRHRLAVAPTYGSRRSCFLGKLKVGSVAIAGVDDMPAMVVGGNVIGSGHRAAQQMVAADDEPQLLARIQCQPDREQVDVHAGDLSGGKLLDAIKAMGRHAVRGVRLIEMAKGRAQATVGAFGSEPLGLMHSFV